jgi:hypothetical protein
MSKRQEPCYPHVSHTSIYNDTLNQYTYTNEFLNSEYFCVSISQFQRRHLILDTSMCMCMAMRRLPMLQLSQQLLSGFDSSTMPSMNISFRAADINPEEV